MVFTEPQRLFILRHRVARLATSGDDGLPHVVPICYALADDRFYSVIDDKPKRLAPGALKRVRNIVENPEVALLIDDYSEDWTKLGYLLVRGRAELVLGGPLHANAVRWLRQRYQQYGAMELEQKPVITIIPTRIVSWGAVG